MDSRRYQEEAAVTSQTDFVQCEVRSRSNRAHIANAIYSLWMAGISADAAKAHTFYGKKHDHGTVAEEQSWAMRMHDRILDKILDGFRFDVEDMRLLHGVLGMISELQELTIPIVAHLFSDTELNLDNIKEELGDLNWFRAETASALNLDLGKIDQENIEKLRRRYKDAFTEKEALRGKEEPESTVETESR